MARRHAAPIRVFEIAERPDKKSPFVVRWVVNSGEHYASFRLKSQARTFHARLITAIDSHERFSNETGVPVSWETLSWLRKNSSSSAAKSQPLGDSQTNQRGSVF